MQQLLKWFKQEHLPKNIQYIGHWCEQLAVKIDTALPESAEKTAGLRKLLEAKDCFVRALIESNEG